MIWGGNGGESWKIHEHVAGSGSKAILEDAGCVRVVGAGWIRSGLEWSGSIRRDPDLLGSGSTWKVLVGLGLVGSGRTW